MNMNLSPRRLWINSNAQDAYQFKCTFTSENMESHPRMPKPDLSTSGSFSRPFHEFFTPFHEFFTAFSHFWVLRCCCIFSWQFPQKQWRHDFQTTKNNFISSKYRTGTLNLQRPSFKPVAPWQVAGNIFFYSYLIGGNVEGDQYLRLAALHFITQSWCWWEVLAILR